LASDGNVLAPADLATIYDIARLYKNGFDGAGQTLVVVRHSNIDLFDASEQALPVNISVNGTVVDLIVGSGSDSLTIPAPPTLQVVFELVRPTLPGAPLGDPTSSRFNDQVETSCICSIRHQQHEHRSRRLLPSVHQ
jgi:hypothetical protein